MVKANDSITVRALLQSPFFEKLYANTYYSLLDRMHSDGYLQESLTGAYEGMFCRTTGPLVMLFIETGRYKEAEQNIQCVLNAITANNMERVPHVILEQNKIFSNENQVDGQAHVILAWARLALRRGPTDFENKTWPLISKLMERTCDRTYLQAGFWSIEPGLMRNLSFEHSREGRRWDTWDLLTQSFTGAALHDMSIIAERHHADSLAADWQKKIKVLSAGIEKNLTTKRNGQTTYLEMRLPDSNGGIPYYGMGWVTLSPIAAEWEGIDHQVMRNTVKVMQDSVLRKNNGMVWMPTDGYADGSVSNEIIGKGMAWEIDFARTEHDYERIKQILTLINAANADKPIYMEGAWLEGEGLKLSARVMTFPDKTVWKSKDAGNGEQCAWWTWSIARLRKAVGLPAEPARVK